MSIRSHIAKIAVGVSVAAAITLGSTLPANAANLPTLTWSVTTKSNHAALDVRMQVTNGARGDFVQGGTKVLGYKNWKIQILQGKKVKRTITGDTYKVLYVEYYLTDNETGFPLEQVSSYAALDKVLAQANSMSQDDLQEFAATRY